MPKCLEMIADIVPTLGADAPIADIASLFLLQNVHEVLVVTDPQGCPLGVVKRAQALEAALSDDTGLTASSILIKNIPCFDARSLIRTALSQNEHSEMALFETGLIITRNRRFVGYVFPASLSKWVCEEQRRLQDERDHAKRAWAKAIDQRFQFIANMGHELRTPLNAMLGYAEMIRDDVGQCGKTKALNAYVDTMHEAGVHLLNIVNTILDMAKVDANLMPLREERVDIPSIVQTCFAMLSCAAERRKIRLTIKAQQGLPKVLADPQIVRQILLNLVSNAIKFSQESGKVLVSMDIDRRGALRVSVKDNGPGMAPKDIEKAMQPYRQLDGDEKVSTSFGTGLGLPLVKAFAELHGGGFQILSAQGKGTKAVVTLPAARVFGVSPAGQGEFILSRPSLQA